MPKSSGFDRGATGAAAAAILGSQFQVNRAPVLTLWAAVVAEALGHPPDTALTLGKYIPGSSARIKARSIGMFDEAMEASERLAQPEALKPAVDVAARDDQRLDAQ